MVSTGDGGYGELKKKFELFVSQLTNKNTIWSSLGFIFFQIPKLSMLMLGFGLLFMQQAKAKDIVVLLKAGIGGGENQAVVQAIQLLEELTVTTTMETTEEPQHMEEVQTDEEHPETETEPEGQGQAQTEAEAMQEALF